MESKVLVIVLLLAVAMADLHRE
jgi:hypothetical protein